MNERTDKQNYFWTLHVSLLDFVDLIKDQPDIKAKLKTKILDAAHEVQKEIETKEE